MVIHPEITIRLLAERERELREAARRAALVAEATHKQTERVTRVRMTVRRLPKPKPATRGCA